MQEVRVRVYKSKELPFNWFKRQPVDQKDSADLEASVKAILNQVKKDGDKALIEFACKFDKATLTPNTLKVTVDEVKEAYQKVTQEQIKAIDFMNARVSAFQKQLLNQKETKFFNEEIAVRTVLQPIESVGCYVPGGQAAYPSTVVMTALPAKIAGVPRIVVCSPSDAEGKVNPLVLVASDICGVTEIYKIGGAQAIAALAYGTQTIAAVQKIVGPGSKYVTMAKVLASTDVAIDMPAGPSEVLILADESADPVFIAYDMISQAEHGTDSVAGLITTSQKLSEAVQDNLAKLAPASPRSEKVVNSLTKYGFVITCESLNEAVKLTNDFAAEHLEVITENAAQLAEKLIAGLILIGSYSPVALSDYASGTNHVLPTGGFAKAFSGLSAIDFMRRVSIAECSKAGLEKVRKPVKVLTDTEDLPNHYRAVEARFTQ
ncbi:MAG: histidinol dehydrogenase [Candidatus Bathyarchaeota archaeon]|nr:histidinol dehydrogenase [Candidatus Bathyarchaeota archaeon]